MHMKKAIVILIFLIYNVLSIYSQTVLVLDFDTEIENFQSNAIIMTDMLRSKLVKTGKINVIDRKRMDLQIEIMENQLSDYMSNQNVQKLGEMMNADYLVIGHVMQLSNAPQSQESKKNFLSKISDRIFHGKDKIEVIVQILDIETSKIISSSSIELDEWTDFSRHTNKITNELVLSFTKKNSTTNQISTNINRANSETFNDTWSSEVLHDGILDTYTITFSENNRITVKVSSIDKKGKKTSSTGTGRYIFNDSEKILSITVNSLSGNVKHLQRINWKTYINLSKDETAFSCIIPVNSQNTETSVKAEFYKN